MKRREKLRRKNFAHREALMFNTSIYDEKQWVDYLIVFENCGISIRKFLVFVHASTNSSIYKTNIYERCAFAVVIFRL